MVARLQKRCCAERRLGSDFHSLQDVEGHEDVYLDELISTIDDAVEKVDDYEKRVATEYPYLTQSDNPEKVRPIEIIVL